MKLWLHKIIQQDFGGKTYPMLGPKWFTALSVIFGFILLSFGAVLHIYSNEPVCIKQVYECGDRELTTFSVNVPYDMGTMAFLYMGLSSFYSTYIGIRMSFSATQLQGYPRSKVYLPYTTCDPLNSLKDVVGEKDKFLPIDAFATDKNWRLWLSEESALEKTLRPCGGLYYWIPTDTFSISTKNTELAMDTTWDLSWDRLDIVPEPKGTEFPYIDPVTDELVWADPSTQKMRAWSRSNMHPNFIVKVGFIRNSLTAGTYRVTVKNCRDMSSEKYIKICSTDWLGYDQEMLALIYFMLGTVVFICLAAYHSVQYLPKPEEL